MTSVDIFAVKEKIVAILKADTTNLWWTNNNPSTKSKFRKIEAGAPSPKAIHEPPLPRCWITSDANVSNVKIITNVASNVPNGTEYEMIFKIIYVVEAKDGPKTEEDIDDFTKSIIEQLQTNWDLRTPGGAESTRLADKSEVLQVTEIPGMRGDRVKGRQIRFKVTSTA